MFTIYVHNNIINIQEVIMCSTSELVDVQKAFNALTKGYHFCMDPLT